MGFKTFAFTGEEGVFIYVRVGQLGAAPIGQD
jgi:hypothetical protein